MKINFQTTLTPEEIKIVLEQAQGTIWIIKYNSSYVRTISLRGSGERIWEKKRSRFYIGVKISTCF